MTQLHYLRFSLLTTAALLTLLALTLTVVGYGLVAGRANHNARGNLVYQICNGARLRQAVSSTCGDLQNATHTEFLCMSNNNDPGTRCWVEER